jgi:transposase
MAWTTATGNPKSRLRNEIGRNQASWPRSDYGSEGWGFEFLRACFSFCGPEPIRVRFKDRYKTGLVTQVAKDAARNGSDPVTFTTNVVIRILARRIQGLNAEMASIDHMLSGLVAATAPSLLDLHGVGVDSAATLLVTTGDNPARLTSEGSWAHLCGVAPLPASTGKTPRHRLNRGGDRQANAALYRIVLTRMSNHPETRRYVTRRRNQGRNTTEIMRSLKRYAARQVFKHLQMA